MNCSPNKTCIKKIIKIPGLIRTTTKFNTKNGLKNSTQTTNETGCAFNKVTCILIECPFDIKEFCSVENIVTHFNEKENKSIWILVNKNSVSYLNFTVSLRISLVRLGKRKKNFLILRKSISQFETIFIRYYLKN